MKTTGASIIILCLIQALTLAPLTDEPSLADGPAAADAMFRAANSADTAEDYDVAIAKYRSLIITCGKSDPTNKIIPRAKARLARLLILEKKFDLAEPLTRDLLTTNHAALATNSELMIDLDDLSDAYAQLGNDQHYGYESLKRSELIRQYINPRHPHLAEGYRKLSEYCAKCANVKDAITWILLAIEVEKHNTPRKIGELARDQNYAASLYFNNKQLDKATDLVNQGLASLAKAGDDRLISIQLHVTMGRIFSQEKQFDKAANEFKIALKKTDPHNQKDQPMITIVKSFLQHNQELAKGLSKQHR